MSLTEGLKPQPFFLGVGKSTNKVLTGLGLGEGPLSGHRGGLHVGREEALASPSLYKDIVLSQRPMMTSSKPDHPRKAHS